MCSCTKLVNFHDSFLTFTIFVSAFTVFLPFELPFELRFYLLIQDILLRQKE